MKTWLHLLQTDCCRFRGRIITYWLLLLADVIARLTLPLGEMSIGLGYAFLGLELLYLILFVQMLLHADPLSGSTAWWMTRPISRRDLFISKNLFMFFILAAPFYMSHWPCWLNLGMSGQNLLAASIEIALYAALFGCFFGIFAAVTESIFHYFITLSWTAILILITQVVIHYQSLTQSQRVPLPALGFNVSYNQSVGYTNAIIFVALLFLLGWLIQCIWKKRLWSIFCIVLAGICAPFLPNEIPQIRPVAYKNIVVETIKERDLREFSTNKSQILWSHFAVKNLGSNELAVVQNCSTRFQEPNGPVVMLGKQPSFHSAESYLTEHHLELFKVIRSFYPETARWFSMQFPMHYRYMQVLSKLPPDYFSTALNGSFEGSIDLNIYAMERLYDLPLGGYAAQKNSAGKFTIQSCKPSPDGIYLECYFEVPDLLMPVAFNGLNSPEDTASSPATRRRISSLFGRNTDPMSFFTLVAYHPEFREAYLLKLINEMHSMGMTLHQQQYIRISSRIAYPAILQKLTGLSATDWMKQARLHVYHPTMRGAYTYSFKEKNYAFSPYATEQSSVGPLVVKDLTEKSTHSEIEQYLDAIFYYPVEQNPVMRDELKQKLMALGSTRLSSLINRVPLGNHWLRYDVYSVLTSLAQPSHIPQLLEALKRDTELIRVFQRKGWMEQAREVMLSLLKQRNRSLPVEILSSIAELKRPDTYPDLAWHFIHLNRWHYHLVPLLEKCPGFPLSETIRLAWKRAQVSLAEPSDLALAAAAEGLPNALIKAICNINSRQAPESQKDLINKLSSLTRYDGNKEKVIEWLFENGNKFQFDPSTQLYSIPDQK